MAATLGWTIAHAEVGNLVLSDPPLLPYSVSARFDPHSAEDAGFVMTDTFQLDEGNGTKSFVRYEYDTDEATYFVEASVADGLVHSLGWSRTLPKVAADSTAAAWLGDFAMQFGFPADVVTDGSTHAVAWIDEPALLRLELIEQPDDEQSGQWEISAVLRKQFKDAK
jgi:hypothetical protein